MMNDENVSSKWIDLYYRMLNVIRCAIYANIYFFTFPITWIIYHMSHINVHYFLAMLVPHANLLVYKKFYERGGQGLHFG